MWDVAWTDPKRELVGERREKKDRDRSVKEKSLSRNSISTTSSKASGQTALSRLRARAIRKSSSSRESTSGNNNTCSEPHTPDNSFNTHSMSDMFDVALNSSGDQLKHNNFGLQAESTSRNDICYVRLSRKATVSSILDKGRQRSFDFCLNFVAK